jgi:hypothetical protein
MQKVTRCIVTFAFQLGIVATLLWPFGMSVAQESAVPGVTVLHGSDDPESIPMVEAYEAIVSGYLLGSSDRGTNFLVYRVGLRRKTAAELVSYARERWKQVIALKLSEAQAICADRENIQSKSVLVQRLKSATERQDALRRQVYDGAFELLDETNGRRFRRYVADYRSELTISSKDIERFVLASPDSLRTMIVNVCSFVE